MSLSFSRTTLLTCSQCHRPFNAEIWLIVDAGERPDLAARCRDGSIHVVACRSGHRGMLGAPLLYHDRAKQQLFLAYPDGMSEQQVQETGAQLVQQLRAQMLILPNTAYLDAPQALPIGLLSAAIDDKLDEVVEQLQQHAAQLEKLRDHPALRVLQEHQALGKTIQEWMNTDSWTESKQFLEAHPELLTNDAELVFAAMLDLARAQEDADAPRVLNEHREILRAARANGIDAAFEKYLARGASNERGAANERAPDARAQLQARLAELDIQSQAEFERALPDHPELQELMQRVVRDENPILQAIEKLMDTRSPQEVIQLVRAYPLLLDDEGMNAMREIIANARERGDQGTANHLQERLAALEQIKASGARVEELAEQAEIQASLDDETEAEIRALIEQEHVQNEQEFRAALEKRPDLREKLERAQAAVSRQSSSAALGDIPADVQPILQEISRLTRLTDMPRKIELCRAALERVPREQNPNLWAALQNEIANALNQNPQGSRADNLEEAIRHYELALEVRTREQFPEQWATTQNNLGNAYRNRIRGERAANLEEAIRHYELALEVRTREQFPEQWATTQNNLALGYSDRIRGERAENLEEAIRHYERALEVYTRAAFSEQWATTQNNLGNAYSDRIRGERAANLEEAIRHYELALEVYTREQFPSDWGMTQNNLANAYSDRIRGERAENLEEAIRHYELALEVYTRAAFPEQWSGTQNNLALGYSDRIRGERAANLEEAIRHYELALEVYTRAAFPTDWGMTQNNLASAYLNRIRGERAANLEEAIRHYELALEVYTREQFPSDWGMTQNNLGEAYRNRIRGERAENLEAAIRHYELALEVRTREQLPQDTVQTARNLGNLYFEQKNWELAHRAFAIARQAAEDLFRVSFTSKGQEAEIAQLARLYDRDLAVCARLYAANGGSASDVTIAREALQESEAARSRVFLRQLGSGDFAPPASIPSALAAQEKKMLAELREIENNLAGTDTRGDRMSEMERTLTDRRKQLADELERVWDEMLAASSDAAEYVSLRRAETPKWDDLSALAARVGQDAAFVEFHLLDDQTLAFVWRAGWDAPKMLALPLTRERLLYRYLLPYEREVLSTYRRSQAQASERELYHDWLALGGELLAPLEPLLGDASLVYFIPHQFLHLLPLHALTVNGEPFIARRAVAYAPSAAVLKRVVTTDDGRQTADDGRQALVMGYTHEPKQREVFVGEALEVAKLFGADAVADEKATRAALAQRAPDASLIHLSCHGAFDGNDSLNSAVALADGLFTARDWMRLNLRADLVTLSACQLAFSDVNPGDDLVGMTRALLYAGASSVLLALWSVQADTTLEWMLDFYKRIQPHSAPQAKAYAFRDATLALRAKYDDPYVWAPFVLVGDWM